MRRNLTSGDVSARHVPTSHESDDQAADHAHDERGDLAAPHGGLVREQPGVLVGPRGGAARDIEHQPGNRGRDANGAMHGETRPAHARPSLDRQSDTRPSATTSP